ncbi:MAG: hypothetical protein ABI462_04700 [Ignavibacteria bacterium]
MKTLICIILTTLINFCTSSTYSAPDYTVKAMNFSYAAPNIIDFDIYVSGNLDFKAGQFIFNFNPGIANGGTLSLIKAPGSFHSITDLQFEPFHKGYVSGSQIRFYTNPLPPNGFQTISDPVVGTKIRRVRLKTTASSFAGTFSDINLSWDISSTAPKYRTKVFYSEFIEEFEEEIENVFEANMTGSYIIESMGIPLSLMHGQIFYDINNNGSRDADELIFPNGILQLSPALFNSASDYLGNYSFFCGTGSNNVSMTNVPNYFTTAPAIRTATFTGPG